MKTLDELEKEFDEKLRKVTSLEKAFALRHKYHKLYMLAEQEHMKQEGINASTRN